MAVGPLQLSAAQLSVNLLNFLFYLLPYSFTSLLVYFFQNRPVLFLSWRS